jgi:serine/threonine protein kinase
LQTLKPLGNGEFSEVYCARGPVGNRVIALKVLFKNINPLIRVREEIQIHYALPHHNNILRMHNYFAERDSIYLVLEFASGNSLYKQKRPFSALTSARYISEVCSGLIHCHQHRVMHRDMKMENLMLGSDGRLKIIDFGFAKSIDDHTNTFCGTPVYQAPEILRATSDGPKYDQRVDIWATGVLLYEFLFYASDEAINKGTTPFRGNNDNEVWESILNSEICWPEEGVFSEVSVDLISRLLVKVPSERISLHDVLTHDFLLNIQNDHDGDDEYDANSRGDDE